MYVTTTLSVPTTLNGYDLDSALTEGNWSGSLNLAPSCGKSDEIASAVVEFWK